MTTTSIWWIRRDLRLTDNQALIAALAHAEKVVPLFVIDPKLINSPYSAPRRIAFLFRGLVELDNALHSRNSKLIVRQGVPSEELVLLLQETGATAIFAEEDFSPFARRRDRAIQQILPLHLVHGITIRPIDAVLKKDNTPYTVFTPYSKVWKRHRPIERIDILPAPQQIQSPPDISSIQITDDLISKLFVNGSSTVINNHTIGEPTGCPTQLLSNSNDALELLPGEDAAKSVLKKYVDIKIGAIYDYAQYRDFPETDGTSLLSPYLRFGMISPRLAALAAYEAIGKTAERPVQQPSSSDDKSSAEVWLNELIWRDFYISILAHFPSVRSGSFRREYDNIVWANDEDDFRAWCHGQTGYPFVDAAMRQLKVSGWMHNRARMVVASFLVKDLLIDWRWGEKWFMQQLLDGDPAANNGGWQWSAGTGTDAAPYFRIFNPISQGKKFDKEGNYVRRWVPELAQVPSKHIHEPWLMPKSEQIKAQIAIGNSPDCHYPLPIVDHKWARERTLAAYKKAKE